MHVGLFYLADTLCTRLKLWFHVVYKIKTLLTSYVSLVTRGYVNLLVCVCVALFHQYVNWPYLFYVLKYY